MASGTAVFSKPDADRAEYYFEGTTALYRSRADGEWDAWSAGPDEVAFSPADFTDKSRLETVGPSEVGTETVDGEELYRFSDAGPAADHDEVEWFSAQLLVDRDGLVGASGTPSTGPDGTRAGSRSGTRPTSARPPWTGRTGSTKPTDNFPGRIVAKRPELNRKT